MDGPQESRPPPHSRLWYEQQALEHGGYAHRWRRLLDGPDPEAVYDELLARLCSGARVLEAGPGDGPDAARFGPLSVSWTGYDFSPALLALARRSAPQASFCEWNGRGEVPAGLGGPFDLVVSRRGPTSVVARLPELAAPGARFLYAGPQYSVEVVPRELARLGWTLAGEWQLRVRAWLPTPQDAARRAEQLGEGFSEALWRAGATARGLPYREERHIVLAEAPA